MSDPVAVTSDEVPAPPAGLFSNAVVCDGIVHVSGQHAGGSEGVATMGMYDQAREALRRVVALVEAAGGQRARIVKLVIYVTDIGLKDELGRARREAFPDLPPASTLVEVSDLVQPELLVEIEAVAHL